MDSFAANCPKLARANGEADVDALRAVPVWAKNASIRPLAHLLGCVSTNRQWDSALGTATRRRRMGGRWKHFGTG